ncbi:hypothetical protein ABK040_015523 [Willaertia magna]
MLLDELPPEIMGIIFSYLSSIDVIKLLSLNKNCLDICNGITQLNISQLIGFSDLDENRKRTAYLSQTDSDPKMNALKHTLQFIATRFPNLETVTLDYYSHIYFNIKSHCKDKIKNDKKYEIFNLILNNLKQIKHLYFHYECHLFGPNLAFHYRNQLESLSLPVSFFLLNENVDLFCKETFLNLKKLFIEHNEVISVWTVPFPFNDLKRNLIIFNFLLKIINQLTHLRFDFIFNIFKTTEEFKKLFTKENKLISIETNLSRTHYYNPEKIEVLQQNTFDNLFKIKKLIFKFAPTEVCNQITEYNLPNLEILDLSNGYLNQNISHTKLKQLILKEMNSNRLVLDCPNLEILNVSESAQLDSLQFKSIHYNLYSIDFCKCKLLTDSCLQNIIENCPLITCLNFLECRNLNNIFNFSNLKNLQKLNCVAPKEFDKYLLINVFNTCPLLSNVTIYGLTIYKDEFNKILKREEENKEIVDLNEKDLFKEWKSLQELHFLNCNLNSDFISYVLNKSKNIGKLNLFNVKSNDNLLTIKIKNDSLKRLNLHSLPELTIHSLNEIITNLPNLENLSICYCSSVTKIINLGKKLKTLELTLNIIELNVNSDSLQELTLKYVNRLDLKMNFKFPNLQFLRFISCVCLKDLNTSPFHLIMKTDSLINLYIDSCDMLLKFKVPNQIKFLEIVNCKSLNTINLQENEMKLQEMNIKNCQKLNVKQLNIDLQQAKSKILSSIVYSGNKHQGQQEKHLQKTTDNKNCNIQ